MLKIKDIDIFTLHIEDCYLCWDVKLKDNITYQIKYRIEKHITPSGNKSKRKIYFIEKDEKKLIFDDEVKKMFNAFKRPYIVNGI
jgi:hypothetical protein|nr:MAG TPA: hypothetical protein [Caudoviricetes sp.]